MAAKNKTTVANPADTISELVEKRDHLVELKGLTEAAPRSFEEAAEDIPKTIEMLRSRCEPQLAWIAQGPTGYADVARQLAQQDEGYAQIPPASLLAWMLPAELSAALKRDLAASYEVMPKPMTSAAKAAELSRLQTEIGQLEATISSAWWSAVDAGTLAGRAAGVIRRRADWLDRLMKSDRPAVLHPPAGRALPGLAERPGQSAEARTREFATAADRRRDRPQLLTMRSAT